MLGSLDCKSADELTETGIISRVSHVGSNAILHSLNLQQITRFSLYCEKGLIKGVTGRDSCPNEMKGDLVCEHTAPKKKKLKVFQKDVGKESEHEPQDRKSAQSEDAEDRYFGVKHIRNSQDSLIPQTLANYFLLIKEKPESSDPYIKLFSRCFQNQFTSFTNKKPRYDLEESNNLIKMLGIAHEFMKSISHIVNIKTPSVNHKGKMVTPDLRVCMKSGEVVMCDYKLTGIMPPRKEMK